MIKEADMSRLNLKACLWSFIPLTAYDQKPFVERFQNLWKIGESLIGKNSENPFERLDIGISKTARGNYTVLVILIHPSVIQQGQQG